MNTSKINASKIKAAGNNFSIIGFTMIAGIIITLIQVFYAANADMRSRGDLESIKNANILFMFLYILCAVIIIVNLISAGSNLSACDEEYDNVQVDNTTISMRETQDGETLKIVSINNETIGAKVYINEKAAGDGTYIYKSLSHKIIVKNGEIHSRYYLESFKDYVFEKINSSEPTVGDKVFNKNWTKVSDGKIRYSLFKHFLIENGVIIK